MLEVPLQGRAHQRLGSSFLLPALLSPGYTLGRTPPHFPLLLGTWVALPSGAGRPRPQGQSPNHELSAGTCGASPWTHLLHPGESWGSGMRDVMGVVSGLTWAVALSPARAACRSGRSRGWALGHLLCGGATPSMKPPTSTASQVGAEWETEALGVGSVEVTGPRL